MEDFNPHHCISGDEDIIEDQDLTAKFQSTPLHQWWRPIRHILKGSKNFNPHHCISGDKGYYDAGLWSIDFNPHHCISGDPSDCYLKIGFNLFQSTPLHQWWHLDGRIINHNIDISIHTTASVVTVLPALYSAELLISIHTTASVVTQFRGTYSWCIKFQSTPLHQWWPFS